MQREVSTLPVSNLSAERHGPVSASAGAGVPRPRALIEIVLGSHGFSVDNIGDHGSAIEHRRRGQARDEAVYIAAAVYRDMSLVGVAEMFKRDVNTILHGQLSFQKRLVADRALAARVFRIVEAARRGEPSGARVAVGGTR